MNTYLFPHIRIAIQGGGDLGSGVAYRLFRAGFPVLITELSEPLLVRRAVSYGSAVTEHTITVEGVESCHAPTLEQAIDLQQQGIIPVIVDPEGSVLDAYLPDVVIDARMRKKSPDTPPPGNPTLFIGLGPGFAAGENCDAVIETMRGHSLGRAIFSGSPIPNTGVPGSVGGMTSSRILRAPVAGAIRALVPIGHMLRMGDPVVQVSGKTVVAPFDGVLRGLVHDGIYVPAGLKIGDVDPRAVPDHCFTISDKSLAVGGGVMEAVFSSEKLRSKLRPDS